MEPLEIVYEDNDIILCRKPAGVATQTKRLGQPDMESLLKNYRARKKEPPMIWVVHRLDQPVEGLMVFAKNPKSAANLSKQIREKIIGKHYYAISACAPKQPSGRLEDYLVTDKNRNVTTVIASPENGKPARLDYQVLKEKEGYTLFDIHLHTGRQHQIRVQMAHMGCPLVGDCKYGALDKGAVDNLHRAGLGLCSYRLVFAHPTTGKKMVYAIRPSADVFKVFY